MPFNLIKQYPDLLEIMHLEASARNQSLLRIYNRDINCDDGVSFNNKRIYPVKTDNIVDLERVFKHLTCEEVEELDENGVKTLRRIFDKDRSQRLHWIKPHVLRLIESQNIDFFSTIERDKKKRQFVKRTYIYDIEQKYVIVLEPQRSGSSYYLLSAYYLNREYGVKMMEKKRKNKQNELF